MGLIEEAEQEMQREREPEKELTSAVQRLRGWTRRSNSSFNYIVTGAPPLLSWLDHYLNCPSKYPSMCLVLLFNPIDW